jgi:hypothetical protein
MLSSHIRVSDYYLDISKGLIPGVSSFHLSAAVSPVNNVELVVRTEDTAASAFVFPANIGESMEVVSSSANDASPSGSGCRTVSIQYLDTDFLEQTVTVALNGTTPVPIVPVNPLKPIARVNRMAGITFAPGVNVAAGNIDVRKVGTTTTNIYRRIGVGDSRAKSSVVTVPANKNFFLYSWHFAISASAVGHYGLFKFWTNGEATVFPTLGAFCRSINLGITQDNHITNDFPVPLRFLPMSDIYTTVVSDSGSAAAIAIAEYYGFFVTI